MGNSSSTELPEQYKRIVLQEPAAELENAKMVVETVDMCKPKSGEVLIKVLAAPVNPSDYGEWSHVVPGQNEPKPQGKEGSGIVIASGGGVYANSVVGKHVGFVSNVKGHGSYAEYTCVNAMEGVFPLPDTVETVDAASHFVNPYTAYGFLDTVRNRHYGKSRPGFVQTAAASQLGQMLVKLCQQENMTLINIVRRDDQAKTLRELGAEHVIVSSKDGWESELKDLVKEHKIQIAFDAIAGEMSGKLLDILPPKGTLFVYGRLSNQGCSGIQPLDLIYRKKKLEGWLFTNWIF
jgi:NADPH:quinone reductase-like Zn-dependent oxidoreductase